MSTDNAPYEYIENDEQLQQLCDRLSNKPYIAIDTEFLRERTYRPQLCLVQVKCEDILALIDALTIKDLTPLITLLHNPNIVKVLHAASQDYEIFYLLSKGKVPTPLFDTQLAAPLLGYNEQIGYGNLVKEHLKIELNKAHTRADWTRRPLPEKQIDYALDDVVYLEQLYTSMTKKLRELGRLDWLRAEFEPWENPKKYDQPAGERWLKIKNIQRYKGQTLACIQALAEWREIKARETNKPRNWLMKDDVLCSLAQQLPDSIDELSHIRGLDKKSKDRYGKELVALIADARVQTPLPAPEFVKKKKMTAIALTRVAMLNAWTVQKAAELKINPGILAPPKLIEQCATGFAQDALQGWRKPLLLQDFNAIIRGNHAIRVTDGGLQLVEL
jgi:ribonuclease D